MLNYQSTSFHDAQYLRRTLGLRPAPQFEQWLAQMGITDSRGWIRERLALGALSLALLDFDGRRAPTP